MAKKYAKKKYKQHYVVYTVLTAILLSAVFLAMAGYFYTTAEAEAEEDLHVQTKQIKDDIILQLISDRENLATMANFAAKLYGDGESYDLMFESFKPIGLIENIGILNSDNVFVTKTGSMDLDGLISFEEEKERGEYVSGRVEDLTRPDNELIRSAVPIKSNGEVVGILYGVIKLDKIGERYGQMAQEYDAQLFVYGKDTGDLVIDTVHKDLGNISFLKDRKYNKNYSYDELISNDKGFVSFESAYRDESLYLHYSTIEELGWVIGMGRYGSQVFAETHRQMKTLIIVFLAMICIIGLYVLVLMVSEKRVNSVTESASEVRKELIETVDGQNNILDALILVCEFAKSRSSFFFDTNDGDYHYVRPEYSTDVLSNEDKIKFKAEIIKYAKEYYNLNGASVGVMCINPNKHLKTTNPEFYNFLKENKIDDVSFATVINRANHVSILGTINAKHGRAARMLAEKVAACFSIALYDKNHLAKTEYDAKTDALTGVMNRGAYENDLVEFDVEQPLNFACVYVDVNELHICNNKYGHAAGDQMLVYIANSLKEAFHGHRVYRVGGDEFLAFCKNTDIDAVNKSVDTFVSLLKQRNYNAALGVSFRARNTNTDEMVKEAEGRMNSAKALYYQEKEQKNEAIARNDEYVHTKTGILEIDTMISVLKEKYNGIYRVSLDTDRARRILMPAYLKYNENEEHFSNLFSKYVSEEVEPDYHRAVTTFLNYGVLRTQLSEGKVPRITYLKHNGETVVLSVHKLGDEDSQVSETLWIFAKK